MSFLVGEQVTLTNTFYNSAGAATDPTTISLAVTTPAGVTTTYTYAAAEITKTAVGVYTKTLTPNAAGTWVYVWTGTGAVADIAPGWFEVEVVGVSYFTTAELRSFDAAFASDTVYPTADLTRVLSEVEAAIEAAAGVSFVRRTASQRLSGTGRSSLILEHYPVSAVSSVTVYTNATTSTAYTAAELADIVPDDIGRIHRSSLGTFALGTHNIVVNYTHGYTSPAAAPKGYLIVRAARELFRTWMKADKASTDPALAGVRSLSVEGYSVTYGDSGGTGVRVVDDLIEQWKARDGVVVA